jgi:hypothetical protein
VLKEVWDLRVDLLLRGDREEMGDEEVEEDDGTG